MTYEVWATSRPITPDMAHGITKLYTWQLSRTFLSHNDALDHGRALVKQGRWVQIHSKEGADRLAIEHLQDYSDTWIPGEHHA